MNPLNILSFLATGIGGIGSLTAGRGRRRQVDAIFEMLMNRAQTGFSPATKKALREQLTATLGNEFGGASTLAQNRIARAGGTAGLQQAAISDLSNKRFQALGQGLANIEIGNEQAKTSALQQLSGLSPLLSQLGLGEQGAFSDLLGAGISGFFQLNSEKENRKFLQQLLSGK